MPTAPNPDGAAGVITDVEELTVWSNGLTGDNDGTGPKAFDGDISTHAFSLTSLVWNGSVPVNSTVTFNVAGSTAGNSKIHVNNKAFSETIESGANKEYTINVGNITLTNFEIEVTDDKRVELYTVAVDGELLIDGKTELTVSSPTNLDTFVADDSLVMVDAAGAVASYVPVTNQITNVDNNSLVYQLSDVTSTGGVPDNAAKAIDGDPTTNAFEHNGYATITVTPSGDIVVPDGFSVYLYVGEQVEKIVK